LSKLSAQALVLLSASHSYSSAVGSVVRRSCPAPDGKGRFVIRATHERGVGVPPSRRLSAASREARPFHRHTDGVHLRQLRRSIHAQLVFFWSRRQSVPQSGSRLTRT
jgi:hypothetical protein